MSTPPIHTEPVLTTERTPVVVTRAQIVMLGIVLGFALFLIVASLVGMYLVFSSKQNESIHANRDALAGLRRLTNPTPAEYRKQLRQGFKRCAAEPLCRRVLVNIVKGVPVAQRPSAGASGASARPDMVARAPGRTSTTTVVQRGPPGVAGSPGTTTPAQTTPAASSGGTSSGGGSSAPPPAPKPPVNVTGPGLPSVCVGGVGGVNC